MTNVEKNKEEVVISFWDSRIPENIPYVDLVEDTHNISINDFKALPYDNLWVKESPIKSLSGKTIVLDDYGII